MTASELMQAMADAGAPINAIIIAVRALEERDLVAAQKRTVERDRKRAQRARERCGGADSHGTVTGQSEDVCDKSSPDKESFPQTPFKEINPSKKTGTPRAREGLGHRLSDDWRPTTLGPNTIAGQIVAQRGQEWAKRALESFRNHWRSANGPTARKRDWQAAWANWVIEQDNRDGRRNGNRIDTVAGIGGNRSRTLAAGAAFVGATG